MKKILSIILISSIFIASCSSGEIEEKKHFKTYYVSYGDVSSKDSILATLEGKNTTELAFKSSGRISKILVNQGDVVRAGQILAILGNEEANISIVGTSDILNDIEKMGVKIGGIGNDTEKIKSSLKKLYDGKIGLLKSNYEKSILATQMSEKDLNLAKETLKNSSKILSGTLLSSEQKIKLAENAYIMAQNNLLNSKKLLELEIENIEKNAINSLTNAYIIARNAKDYIDLILGVTDVNKYKNDLYENYIGAKNSNSKNQAEKSFLEFLKKYDQTYKLYQEIIVNKTNISRDNLQNVLSNALETLNDLRNVLHDTMNVLDNSMISSNFDEKTLYGMKTQISSLIGALEQAILNPSSLGMIGVKGSIEAINTFDKNYDLKIKQLEDTSNIALDDFNLAKTGKDITKNDNSKNISSLETNVSIKQDILDLSKINEEEILKSIELVNQEKVLKISEIDAKLGEIDSKISEVGSKKAEMKMNGNLAENNLESGIIKAPFDGIILKKMVNYGIVVGAGTPILSITSSDGKFIKTYINNDNYNLNKGSPISLLNEKDKKSFSGSIFSISNTKDLVSNKNYIEIKVDDKDSKIGERYILNLLSQKKEKQIVIPLSAIVNKYSVPGVFVIKNNEAKFKILKLGDSDDNFVVVEGLKIGDKIITEGKDNIIDGEKIK